MTTVSRLSRQNDAGLRALNVALWENLALGSKGPYFLGGWNPDALPGYNLWELFSSQAIYHDFSAVYTSFALYFFGAWDKLSTGLRQRQVSFAGHRSQVTGHCFTNTESIRPKVSFYKCLGYFLYW